MKTTILTAAILLVTVLGFSKSTYAVSTSDHEVSTLLTNVNNINEIEVHGNVELYVSSGTADQVKVYNSYYAESALVQDQDGVLRISSYTAKKLIVWVTASDLRTLSVYDNAEVKSFGKLSAINLDVNLYNTAAAKLELDTFNTNITLSNQAKADLAGNTEEANVKYDRSSFLNVTNFTAAKFVKALNYEALENNNLPEVALL